MGQPQSPDHDEAEREHGERGYRCGGDEVNIDLVESGGGRETVELQLQKAIGCWWAIIAEQEFLFFSFGEGEGVAFHWMVYGTGTRLRINTCIMR